MDIKVNGPRGPQKTEKSKKSRATGATDGPRFADFLDTAGETTETTETADVGPLTGVANHLGGSVMYDIPQEPEEHGKYLLKQLEELEQDILSGQPTAAIERLKQALEKSPLNDAELTDKQREILDSLHLRVAVELEKINQS